MRDLCCPTVEEMTACNVRPVTWFSKPPPKFKSASVPIRFVIQVVERDVQPVSSERSNEIGTDVSLTGTLAVAFSENELGLALRSLIRDTI